MSLFMSVVLFGLYLIGADADKYGNSYADGSKDETLCQHLSRDVIRIIPHRKACKHTDDPRNKIVIHIDKYRVGSKVCNIDSVTTIIVISCHQTNDQCN